VPNPTTTPITPYQPPFPIHWLNYLWLHHATLLEVFYAFLIAAALASFLGVVADRLPRRQPLTGRSHCVCGRQLTAGELIPILGWLWIRLFNQGTTSCCGVPIPSRYPLAELFLATSSALIVGFLHFSLPSVTLLALAVVITFLFLRHGSHSDLTKESYSNQTEPPVLTLTKSS
jgi:prepilin signal peptidase PulO-like enzyme (type II secretory pathway)